MNFYKAADVRAKVSIPQYFRDQGIPMQGSSRAVAKWRGGTHFSVSINNEKNVWFDHKEGAGGDLITAFIKIEGGTPLSAIRTLGDRYGVEPFKQSVTPPKATRGENLVAQGYKLIRSYEYQNEDGTPRYWVDRYEMEGKKKEFLQRGPNGENLHGVEKTLYHLPALKSASLIHLCEGEKDADTLTKLGLTATTNSGGAKYWKAEFGKVFDGKDVVIHLDNDEAGQSRAKVIVGNIAQYAKSVRVLTISKLPKGDVTDWFEREGGTLSALCEAVDAAPLVDACPREVSEARLANTEALRNYDEELSEGKNGKPKMKRNPRRVDDICDEMSTRFLGFPKVLGTQLFDFDLKRKEIKAFNNEFDLRAWINGVSGHQSDFQTGGAFASYKEVMSRLLQTRPRYDVVAKAPWWPARTDAFSAFDHLPEPDPTHSKFNELMSFFSPATIADAMLIRAFYMAPMLFIGGERPGWIVDSVDGQGSGKSKVVEKCCLLYNESPMRFDLNTMSVDINRVTGQLLSGEGREKRIVLFDNVTQSFRNANLATMITSESISGRRPYGHGTETRRNDITWTATSNGATVDTDMAVRFYVVHVKAPANKDPMWEDKVDSFIEQNRAEIQAEIMDMLRTAVPRVRKVSRFGKFDSIVLSAACATDENFALTDAKIGEASEAANDDNDLASQFVEAMNNAIASYVNYGLPPAEQIRTDLPMVIRCTDVDGILRKTQGGVRNWTSKTVRRFVNAGKIVNILKGVERVQTAEGKKLFNNARCFVYSPCLDLLRSVTYCQFVTFDNGIPRMIGVGTV